MKDLQPRAEQAIQDIGLDDQVQSIQPMLPSLLPIPPFVGLEDLVLRFLSDVFFITPRALPTSRRQLLLHIALHDHR
jgi:hypothetical protein